MLSFKGSPYWMAPEVTARLPSSFSLHTHEHTHCDCTAHLYLHIIYRTFSVIFHFLHYVSTSKNFIIILDSFSLCNFRLLWIQMVTTLQWTFGAWDVQLLKWLHQNHLGANMKEYDMGIIRYMNLVMLYCIRFIC